MLHLGNDYNTQILRTWTRRTEEIWETEDYNNSSSSSRGRSPTKNRDKTTKRLDNSDRTMGKNNPVKRSDHELTQHYKAQNIRSNSLDDISPADKEALGNSSVTQDSAHRQKKVGKSLENDLSYDTDSSSYDSSDSDSTDSSDSDGTMDALSKIIEERRKKAQAKITGKKLRILMKQAVMKALAENKLPDLPKQVNTEEGKNTSDPGVQEGTIERKRKRKERRDTKRRKTGKTPSQQGLFLSSDSETIQREIIQKDPI